MTMTLLLNQSKTVALACLHKVHCPGNACEFFAIGVSVLLPLVLLPLPAQAWTSNMDSVRLCNKNQNHDIDVAVVSKGVPKGIAALMAAHWRHNAWYTVKAGKCELTMPLYDVQNYEIWLYVQVVGGEQIHWNHRLNDRFCLHPTEALEFSSWAKKDLQTCAAGQRLETFSYITSLYNADDAYSIYSVENRTIDLSFDYTKPTVPRASATPPAAKTSPKAANIPQAEKKADSPKLPPVKSQPALSKLVLICTPLILDRHGNFFPQAKQAIDNGEMTRHFSRVNEVINGMKKDRNSRLNQILINEASHVQLIVSPYFEAEKSIRLQPVAASNNLQCQSGYRAARYDAAQWLKQPNLSPRGLQNH